jgi:hypothetical protein
VDEAEPVAQTDCVRGESERMRWSWKRWATWGNVGLLLAAVVLPLGWLLPAARLARVHVRSRRARDV